MKTSMLVVTLALATLYGSPASAEGDGTGDVPCNAWCRHWLNMGSPPVQQPDLDPRAAMPAQPVEIIGGGVVTAKPPLNRATGVTLVKRVRSARAPVAPRRLRAQRDPAAILPRPRPASAATEPDAAGHASRVVETRAATVAPAPSATMPAPAPATKAPAPPPPVDAAASAQIIAMLAPPALPADPVLIVQPQAPASQTPAPGTPTLAPMPTPTLALALALAPTPKASTSLPGALPVVAQRIAMRAASVPSASANTSLMNMPPAFDVIATLLLDGPTRP